MFLEKKFLFLMAIRQKLRLNVVTLICNASYLSDLHKARSQKGMYPIEMVKWQKQIFRKFDLNLTATAAIGFCILSIASNPSLEMRSLVWPGSGSTIGNLKEKIKMVTKWIDGWLQGCKSARWDDGAWKTYEEETDSTMAGQNGKSCVELHAV